MTPAPAAAIYARISADREGREYGVDRQQEDCRLLAERLGLHVVAIYVDNDISASTRSKKSRPQYRQMIEAAQAGQFTEIIACTSARVTRRPREHEDLIELAERHGVTFHYTNSPSFDLNTSAGRMIARFLAASDAGEAEEIQERVQRQKLQAARDGVWKGGRRPFGYRHDGMGVQPEEAQELLDGCKAVLAGQSVNGLLKDWNSRGILTSAGNLWTSHSVLRVLQRPRNAGFMEHQGEVIGKATWPAIVPEDIWRGVCALLGDPSRRTTPGPARRWLGSGLYMCVCGATVRVHLSGGRNRREHHAYTCSARKHLTRIASEVDALVGDVVVERLSRPDAIDLLAAGSAEDATAAMAEAAVIRGRLDDAAMLFAKGTLTASQLAKTTTFMREELAAAESRMAAASRGSVLGGLIGADDVRAVWDELGLDRQRAVIDRLFTVKLVASERGRPKGWRPGESYFDPATVRFLWKG